MWNKLKISHLLQTYYHLPLWGKIVAPLVLIFLASSLFSMMKTVFYLGLLGLGIYAVVSFYYYSKKRRVRKSR